MSHYISDDDSLSQSHPFADQDSQTPPEDSNPCTRDILPACPADHPSDINEVPPPNSAVVHDQDDVDDEDEDFNPPPPVSACRKRKYTYMARVPKDQRPSEIRQRWGRHAASFTETKIRKLKCCKEYACYQACSPKFLHDKVAVFTKLSRRMRRKALEDLLGSDGSFHFDGRKVCGKFLSISFGFSRDLQASVRANEHSSTRISRRTQSSAAPTSQNGYNDVTTSQHGTYCLSDGDTTACALVGRSARIVSKDAIITFLERLADSTADYMPNVSEIHIPFFRKGDVYRAFVREHSILYGSKPSTQSYFFHIWKHFCSQIKVRKIRPFSNCSRCDELRDALAKAVQDGLSVSHLKKEKEDHNSWVRRERLEYYKRRDQAILHSQDYCSVIVDGADQSAFGLPHFMVKTKSERGHAMKVRLIGLLEHGRENILRLFTLTEEHETGANHVVETVHRFLQSRVKQGPLPRIFYIQVDNTSRENKNRFFLSYCESLVAWQVFDSVQVSFLPVGHTHEDIDQSFSVTADRLRHNDAITLDDLHSQLRETYNSHTQVSRMACVVNWSGLVGAENCLRPVRQFTKYRYFAFSRSARTDCHTIQSTSYVSTTCDVKINVTDPWISLPMSRSHEVSSFLTNPPDMSKTPPTIISSPPGVDEVTKRINSVEGRINSTDKVKALLTLRDDVFRSREELFHWDVFNIVELNKQSVLRNEDLATLPSQVPPETDDTFPKISAPGADKSTACAPPQATRNDYKYNTNEFVAIKTEVRNGSETFGIGKVNKVLKENGVVTKLEVHWLEPYNSKNIYTAKYAPAKLFKGKKAVGPWRDIVSTDSVIVTFQKLNNTRTLPSAVQRQLRSEFPPRF